MAPKSAKKGAKRGRKPTKKRDKARVVGLARRKGAQFAADYYGLSLRTVQRYVRDLRQDPSGVRAALEDPPAAEEPPDSPLVIFDTDGQPLDLVQLPGGELEAAREARRMVLRVMASLTQRATAADLRWVVTAYQAINDAVIGMEFLSGAGGPPSDRAGSTSPAG